MEVSHFQKPTNTMYDTRDEIVRHNKSSLKTILFQLYFRIKHGLEYFDSSKIESEFLCERKKEFQYLIAITRFIIYGKYEPLSLFPKE